ncbi:MAG: phosphate ABC transporter permease subunit PstC [Pseudomonadota bacterium]
MIWSRRNSSSPSRADTVLARASGGIALAVAVLLGLVLLLLVGEALPILDDGGWLRFINSDGWFPSGGRFNLLPMLWATLAVSLGALLIAVPLGVSCALFSRFFAPAFLVRPLRRVVMLLAGIPSVVYGLWGLTVIVPLIARWEPPGASLLAAILILALMVLPTVALTSEAALAAVSPANLQGAAALGLGRKAVVLGVALPEARAGIVTGAILAAMRALGETMAVLMVAGNVVQTPHSLFDPVRVLTANIALEMPYATGEHRAALFASGLLLMMIVTALAWLAGRRTGGLHV